MRMPVQRCYIVSFMSGASLICLTFASCNCCSSRAICSMSAINRCSAFFASSGVVAFPMSATAALMDCCKAPVAA